jgi:pimeloyl-[acyl-carrier protein] methyl ester esterase
MHSGIWRDFAIALSRNYRVTTIDLPGHGLSSSIKPCDLVQIGDVLVNELEQGSSCWLGWSLGSVVVLDICRRYPERVNSLVLLAGTPKFTCDLDAQWAGIRTDVLKAFARSLTKDCQATLMGFLSLQTNNLPNADKLLKQLETAVFEFPVPDTDTLLGGLDILEQTDLRSTLANLKIPVCSILGEKDTLVPVAIRDKLQQLLPAINTHVIKGAGHVPFLSHPGQLLEIISGFLEQPGKV